MNLNRSNMNSVFLKAPTCARDTAARHSASECNTERTKTPVPFDQISPTTGGFYSPKRKAPRVHFRSGHVQGKGLTANSLDLLLTVSSWRLSARLAPHDGPTEVLVCSLPGVRLRAELRRSSSPEPRQGFAFVARVLSRASSKGDSIFAVRDGRGF